MISFPLIIGILGWLIIILFIILFIFIIKLLILKFKFCLIDKLITMKKGQLVFGALITLSINAILFLTVLGEEIIKYGFIAANIIIFIFVSITKIAIGNAVKDNQSTDWKSIFSFIGGSLIASIIVLGLGLLAIG